MPPLPQNLTIETVPCLSDNYAYLIHNADTGETALVDAPESDPIAKRLADRGWTLTDILITHHHDDHIDGVAALRSGTRVYGNAADQHRLPPLDVPLSAGSSTHICGLETRVIDVPGHTIGHIAFYMPAAHAAFTADSLMALGCGRLFEGTPDQMWDSLQKLRALPAQTMIYSGHEYTASNAKFALTIEPGNSALISRSQAVTSARAAGQPTVPTSLADEIATNPFLRADVPALLTELNQTGADAKKVFAEIRRRKDSF